MSSKLFQVAYAPDFAEQLLTREPWSPGSFGLPGQLEPTSLAAIATVTFQHGGDERRPHFVGLPKTVHEGKRALALPALLDDTIQADKRGDPHVCRTVNPYLLAFMRLPV